MPHLCHLQTAARTLPVHVEMVNNKLYFRKGFNVFLQENGLKYGQLLVFHYAGNSQFHVDIFGGSTCGQLLAMSETEEADEEDDDVSGKSRKKYRRSSNGKARKKNKEAYWSEIRKKDRRGTSSPKTCMDKHLCRARMMKKQGINPISQTHFQFLHHEEGVVESQHDEETENEQEEDDHCSETLNYAPSDSRTVASRHHQRRRNRMNSIAEAQSNLGGASGLSGDERILNATALEKANAFKPFTHPSFVISLCSSYAGGSYLNIPRSFVITHMSERHPNGVTLWVKRSFWDIKVNYLDKATRLQAGWSEFVRVNNLKVGDVCVFVLTNDKTFHFEVEIFRMQMLFAPHHRKTAEEISLKK